MLIRRIVPVYDECVAIGQNADVFHSFAPCGDRLVGVYRRFKLIEIRDFGNEYVSANMLREFDPETGVFLSEPVEIMNPGEDPRCILIGDRPFVVSKNPPGGGFNYALFDVQDRKATNIVMEDAPDFIYGKNWQPYVVDGELYVVHEFHPFRIIHIDVATGRGRIVFERDLGFGLKSRFDGYNCYRGGCSALNVDGKIVGFGHFNSDPGRHELFKWTFSPQGPALTVSFDIDVRPLREQGMAIFDPTCFFRFRDVMYLGLSCSNREWFYGQRFISVLLELDDSAGASPDKSKTAALPTTWFRRAMELEVTGGRVYGNFDVIAKAGEHPPGCVLRGGPRRIAPGKYRLRVQYAGAGDAGTEVGLVTVFAVKERRRLAMTPLQSSGERLTLTDLGFEALEDDAVLGLEVQIDSTGAADLRVSDIAIRSANDVRH